MFKTNLLSVLYSLVSLIAFVVFASLAASPSMSSTESITASMTSTESTTASTSSLLSARQNAPTSISIPEMYPRFGRSLEISPELEKEWEKAAQIMRHTEVEKLTTANKQFFKQIGFDYKNWSETDAGLYNAIDRGCSWYCSGATDSVTASSHLKSNNPAINYLPENAHDLTFRTAWVEGVEGYGIGEYIVYHLAYFSQVKITEIKIANGYVKTEQTYLENSRVKTLKLYIDDIPAAILHLEDRRVEQIFDFEPMRPKTVRFEILDVYPGEKYADTAITGIYFDGIDIH